MFEVPGKCENVAVSRTFGGAHVLDKDNKRRKMKKNTERDELTRIRSRLVTVMSGQKNNRVSRTGERHRERNRGNISMGHGVKYRDKFD